jgi:hypothetical protein
MKFIIRYNKYLLEYEKINLTNVKFNSLNHELKSEFFFLTGLFVLKAEKSQNRSSNTNLDFLQEEVNEYDAIFISSSSNSIENSKLSAEKLIALFCFTKSNVLSKPNNNTDHSTDSSKHDPESPSHDLIRLIQRDCCWKYSIAGNWLKFVINKYFANDQIEFLKQIKQFSVNTNVKIISLSNNYLIWTNSALFTCL